MKKGRAIGKERAREKRIEGAGVGGKQEDGDHSEGKEEDRKIIRHAYAFAHEREREKRGRGNSRP